MRKILFLILIMVAVVVLAGCEKVESPDCICPAAEECELCSVCPEPVTKYVCPDGVIVDNAEACLTAPTEIVTEVSKIDVKGIVTDEATATWETIIEPACVLGKNGGRINYEATSLPANVSIEAKEYGGTYSDVYTFKGLYDANKYFLVCNGGSCYGADFVLNSGKVYLLRVMYEMVDGTLSSQESIVDLREDSEYTSVLCTR